MQICKRTENEGVVHKVNVHNDRVNPVEQTEADVLNTLKSSVIAMYG